MGKMFAYTDEMNDFIRRHKDLSNEELAIIFNKKFGTRKSKDAMRGCKVRLGLSKKKIVYSYTSEQKEFIRDSISEMNCDEITKLFNEKFNTTIPADQIRCLVRKEGYRPTRKQHRHTKEEIDFIVERADMDVNLLTMIYNEKFGTNVSKYSVHQILRRAGIIRDRTHRYTQEQIHFFNQYFTKMKGDEFEKSFNDKFETHIALKELRQYANNKLNLYKHSCDFKEIKPIGTIVEHTYPDRKRKYIKVSQKKGEVQYLPLERWVYEQGYGVKLSGGHIIHLNGNVEDFDIDNLYYFENTGDMNRFYSYFSGAGNTYRDRTVALTAIELTKLERCIDEHIKTVRHQKKENK